MLRFPFLLLTILSATLQLNAQTSHSGQRVPANVKVIPSVVVETFKETYPHVLVKSWYVTHITYWQQDVSSGWYTDWYGNTRRNVVVFTYEKPNYFEVEFIDQFGLLSRAVYNRYGFWHETRSQLKGLPMACLNSLTDSKYKDWKRSTMAERIETAEWPETIYRFGVSKGWRYHILKMNELGEIVQVKYLDEE